MSHRQSNDKEKDFNTSALDTSANSNQHREEIHCQCIESEQRHSDELRLTGVLARLHASRVHNRSLIYCNNKPDSFLIATPPSHPSSLNSRCLLHRYRADSGMAKHYQDPKTKQYILYREQKSLSGIARYMSIDMHLG